MFKTAISDLCFYIPIWHTFFAHNLYFKQIDYTDLKINTRFSIRPIYNATYDRRLYVKKLESPKIKILLDKELNGLDTESAVLFLSEPVAEEPKYNYKIETEALKRALGEFDKSQTIVVKFHPREDDVAKEKIISVLKGLSLKYIVICNSLNIPVEYFLLRVKFKKILTFFCSTILYNGYAYPKVAVTSMMPLCYDEAQKIGDRFIIRNIQQRLNDPLYKLMFEDE